jgi:hypothetical protein
MESENIDLNKLPFYINKICVNCGRKYPETILNIEGFIHHKEPFRCLDLKQCKRIVRKNKKRVLK